MNHYVEDNMIKEKPSNVQLIINTLMSGETLRSNEIAEKVSEAAGKEIKIQDVASMLSRITNEDVCDLGYFILKNRDGKSYVYKMADEFLALSEDKAYGLTRKTGDARYTLEEAVTEVPELAKYIAEAKKKSKSRRRKKTTGQRRTAETETKTARKTREPREITYETSAAAQDGLQVLMDALSRIQDLNIHVTVTLKVEGV